MARRTLKPLLIAAILMAAGAALLAMRPQLLAPAATRLFNRQLQAHGAGQLRVGSYHLRFLEGLDLQDVTFTSRGRGGALTLVAIDTLQLDFRVREALGRSARLRKVVACGVEIYHNEGRREDPAARPTRLSLPHLSIDHFDLRAGRVEISRSDGRLRERIDDLNWLGELELAGERLRLVAHSGGLDWSTRRTRLENLFGTVSVDTQGVHLAGLAAAWNEGQVAVSGQLKQAGLRLTATGRNISTDEVNDLTGLDLDFTARGDIDCTIAAEDDTVRFGGTFSGRLAQWDLREVYGEAIIAGGLAAFQVVRGGVGGAWFDGTLAIDERPGTKGAIITLQGRAGDLDLRAGLIPEARDLPRTGGTGNLEIVHTTADHATVVRGQLTSGFIEFMPFDDCRVDVWARDDSLHFRTIDLRHGGLRASLAGTSDRRDVFSGRLRLTAADLSELPPDWGWPRLRGRCEGQVALDGPLTDLGLVGGLFFQDLTLGPVEAQVGEAALAAERILADDWTLSAAVTGDGFALGAVPLGSYLSWLRADATSVAVDSFQTVLSDTAVSLVGRVDFQPAQAQITVDRLHLGLGGNDWRGDGTVTTILGPGIWQLPHFSLTSSQGELTAAIDYRAEAEVLDGRLELANINLDVLDAVLDWPRRTGGRVTARIEIAGRPAEPALRLRGVLRDAAFPLARLDSLAVAGVLQGGTVRLDTLELASDYGQVSLRGTVAHPGVRLREFWPDAGLDVQVAVRNGDWSFLHQFELPALVSLAGRFDGDIHLSGTTTDPLVTGDLKSVPFRFSWLSLQELTGTVRADAAQLALGNLRGRYGTLALEGRLEIPLRFDLLHEPHTPDDGPFYGQVRIPPGTDLAPLMHATGAFARSAGRGQGELTVSGPLARPLYFGQLAADGLELVIRDTEEVYREGKVRGVFRDDTLYLQEISGRAGLRGTFTGEGTVTFAGLELQAWDIVFQADRFLVASIPDLRALVRTRNGRLTSEAVGPQRRLVPRFSGDYELIRGRYTGNFTAASGAQDPTLGTLTPDWLADLRVTGAPRTFRVINRTMELDLSGDVSLARDADGMVLSGSMGIDAGRLPVFNNTFKVVRGSLDFSREVGVVPNVDIDAETRVRLPSQIAGSSVVERLTVHATGPADAMAISYSSESGYPREAIERMLLGLSPYPDEQGDQAAFTSASIGAGLNLLEREIAREIGIFDTFEIDQIQRQQTGTTGLDPLIGVGKYVGTDLYIKYAQGLNQNDRDLLIEYQITNSLLLQTEIRRRIDEYQGDATYNLDLKYRVEY